MSVLIGAASALSLRHSLMDRLDSQLVAAAERAQARRHPDSGRPPSASPKDQAAPTAPDPAQAGSPAGSQAQSPDGAHRLPPGLDAAGQATGTLAVVAPADAAGTTLAAYIDDSGTYRELSQAETSALLALPATGQPVAVDIDTLGDYRVLVSHDRVSGDTVVTGLSLASDQALIRRQLALEAAIALSGALLAAWLGRALVRRRLAPLERVADTARQVASQPLARGQVSISERVSAADLASSSEVRQVGRALNTLLAHVDEALAVRQRSEEQVRQFVADASHELRTPLASVRGYTELLQRQLGQGAGAAADGAADGTAPHDVTRTAGAADEPRAAVPEETAHALARVRSEAERMTGLVEDLLLLARLDAGRELRHDEVDLLALTADAVADAQVAGPDHSWELDLTGLLGDTEDTAGAAGTGSTAGTADVGTVRRADRTDDTTPPEPAEPDGYDHADEAGLPVVVGDEERLRQVLGNLLTNARVHTPAGTHVTVRLRAEDHGRTWAVDITDDGPGIPPGLRERVFERFARGDAARERAGASAGARSGSTGLGTSIALAIVRSHGGTLTLASRTAAELPVQPGATVGTPASPGTVVGTGPNASDAVGQHPNARTAVGTGSTFTVRLPAA